MTWAEQILFLFLRCDKRSHRGELLAQGYGAYKLQNSGLLVPRSSFILPHLFFLYEGENPSDLPEIERILQHYKIYDISKIPVEI